MCTVEDLGVFLTDAVIIDDQITILTATQDNHFVSWDRNDFQIFAIQHTEHFKNDVRCAYGPVNFEYFILLAVEIDLVGVLRIAKFTGADLVDGCGT